MESVLVACRESEDFAKISKAVKKHFNVIPITSPEMFKKIQNKIDVMLLDHNFTANSGIEFLMSINRHKKIPILFLTPDNDPQCAVEAMRAGAFNYIVKTGNYVSILNIAIKDALAKFNERKNLKDKITELQERINELEEKNGRIKRTESSNQSSDDENQNQSEPEKKEINLIEEIISRFKRGEINLPSLPQINIKFKKMISQGANIQDVAKLLKQDIAISSTLINISNTAFYRGIEENKTLENAISRLGLGTTRQYVEVISNRSLYTCQNKKYAAIMEKLWIHSLSCAFASELITNKLNINTENDTFTLGLIHDIGKLVLLQIVGELETKGKFEGLLQEDKLHDTLAAFHGRFGAVLLKRWEFSSAFVEVAMYHDSLEDVKTPSTDLLIVHFANLLVNSMGYSIRDTSAINPEDSKSCYLLRLRPDDIEDFKVNIKQYINELKGVI